MKTDTELRARFEQARDKLVAKYIYHPDVTLIDIGHPLVDEQERKELVLRIHVKARWMERSPEQRINFPEELDGIPVIIMTGDYKLE